MQEETQVAAEQAPHAEELPCAEELGLSFSLNEQGQVYAHLAPNLNTRPLTEQEISVLADEAGYPRDQYPFFKEGVAELVLGLQRKQAGDVCLGGARDAHLEVFASRDALLAGVQIYPALGQGQDLTLDQVQASLKSARVVYGVCEDTLAEMVQQASDPQVRSAQIPLCFLVAFGEPAQEGTNARLEILVDQVSDRRPVKDDKGHINYRDMGEFPFVEPETPLVRKIPAFEGKDGIGVHGRKIRCYRGRDIRLRLRDESVKLDPEDDNLILAAKPGLPVILSDGALVDDVLKVEEVNLQTGHIDFRGSVLVKGNIDADMQVKVTGDIFVKGLVEKAYLEAGGNIEIGGGVLGLARPVEESKPNLEAPNLGDAVLRAQGHIQARFIQEAWVQAGAHVIVQRQILNASVQAQTYVSVLGEGRIVGSQVQAVHSIEAGILGSNSSVNTRLQVGQCDEHKAQLVHLDEALQANHERMQQLKALVAKLKLSHKPIPEAKKEQILKAKHTLQLQAQELLTQQSACEAEIKARQRGRIHARKTCFAGVSIEIAGQDIKPRNTLGKITFFLKEGEISMR